MPEEKKVAKSTTRYLFDTLNKIGWSGLLVGTSNILPDTLTTIVKITAGVISGVKPTVDLFDAFKTFKCNPTYLTGIALTLSECLTILLIEAMEAYDLITQSKKAEDSVSPVLSPLFSFLWLAKGTLFIKLACDVSGKNALKRLINGIVHSLQGSLLACSIKFEENTKEFLLISAGIAGLQAFAALSHTLTTCKKKNRRGDQNELLLRESHKESNEEESKDSDHYAVSAHGDQTPESPENPKNIINSSDGYSQYSYSKDFLGSASHGAHESTPTKPRSESTESLGRVLDSPHRRQNPATPYNRLAPSKSHEIMLNKNHRLP